MRDGLDYRVDSFESPRNDNLGGRWECWLISGCERLSSSLSLRARQGVAIQSESCCRMPECCDRCLRVRWIAASLRSSQ